MDRFAATARAEHGGGPWHIEAEDIETAALYQIRNLFDDHMAEAGRKD